MDLQVAIKHVLKTIINIIFMKSRGRPAMSPIRLKDGFYIEVIDKGAKTGMKIRSDSKIIMQATADRYSGSKKVVILGEYKDGVRCEK